MKAEVITVGTELMIGKTLDTHSAFISNKCSALGIAIQFHSSTGDNQNNLLSLFKLAVQRSDIVFVCGGLGPTNDDITTATLFQFLESSVGENDLITFPNEYGTVSGFAVERKSTVFVVLPGPPQELIPMFETYVIPFFVQANLIGEPLHHVELSFFGLGESKLERKVRDVIAIQPKVYGATYINGTGVTLRLTAAKEAMDQVYRLKENILQRVGDYCFSDQGETLPESVVRLLSERDQQIVCAESCTGGFLSYLFSSVSGSSKVFLGGFVSYANSLKEKWNLVDSFMLQKYGAIHAKTAQSMAEKALSETNSDYALSITGIAGPSSIEEQPVGRIYIGFAEKKHYTRIYQLSLQGSRKKNQQFAADHALFILQQRLRKVKKHHESF